MLLVTAPDNRKAPSPLRFGLKATRAERGTRNTRGATARPQFLGAITKLLETHRTTDVEWHESILFVSFVYELLEWCTLCQIDGPCLISRLHMSLLSQRGILLS